MTDAPNDRPRRLLAVFPHPDDESYGCAGLLARLGAAPDAATALLCLTRGEASKMGTQRGLTPAEVGALRTERLERVRDLVELDVLDVRDLPDGGLARLALDVVAAVVGEVLDTFRPHVVIAHCARGVNGHLDHVATHWAVRRALADRPGIRLAMVAYRKAVCDSLAPCLLFPTKDEHIDVTLRLDERETAAKEACLRVHDGIVTLYADRAQRGRLLLRPPVEEFDLLGECLTAPTDDVFSGIRTPLTRE